MAQYFRAAPAEDAAWAVFFPDRAAVKRLISGRTLRAWALRYTGLPEWLVGDAQAATGDSAETVTLLVHRARLPKRASRCIAGSRSASCPARAGGRATIRRGDRLVAATPAGELFVLNKLLTGAFRVGVSQPVVRALGAVRDAARHHRPSSGGQMAADATWYQGLLAAERADDDPSRPYPFFLASPLEQPPHRLGSIDRWLPNGNGMASAPS